MGSSFTTYQREDGIIVLHVTDTGPATIQAWEKTAVGWLEACISPEKRLYDMRELSGVSMHALRVSVKLRAHPNAHFIYTAVLSRSNRVANIAQMILRVRQDNNMALFTEETEAINWLNETVTSL